MKYRIVEPCSVVVDGRAVHYTRNEVGQTIDLPDEVGHPLVEAGKLNWIEQIEPGHFTEAGRDSGAEFSAAFDPHSPLIELPPVDDDVDDDGPQQA